MGSYKWVISRVSIVITYITPLITTHEPPSTSYLKVWGWE